MTLVADAEGVVRVSFLGAFAARRAVDRGRGAPRELTGSGGGVELEAEPDQQSRFLVSARL